MDDETYNRLFILGGKGCDEEEWRTAFSPYGNITNIQVVTDRRTGEQKGIAYVTYEKISEAAKALEEMNGKFLPNYPKPLKVMIASSKREGNVKDSKEDEKILRLFIVCDKSSDEAELKEHFGQFGETEYVRILRDRVSKESKGLAYVKYYRAYHAALAYEGCNPRYKPRFAELKGSGRERQQQQQSGFGGPYGGESRYMPDSGGDYYRRSSDFAARPPFPGPAPAFESPFSMAANYSGGSSGGGCRLEAMLVQGYSSEAFYKLFDIAPGLESLDYDRNTGVAYIKYQTSACAAYAKEKIMGLEFPPGNPINIRFYEEPTAMLVDGDGVASLASDLSHSVNNFTGDRDGISTLVKSIQKATQVLEKAGLGSSDSHHRFPQRSPSSSPLQATQVLEKAGLGSVMRSSSGSDSGVSVSGSGSAAPSGGGSGKELVRWCGVSLPYRRPLEQKDTPCEERLFIVSQPEAFPDHVLVDLLCRFGGLIDAYFMPGKNYGYAKFSKLEYAKAAMELLHGQNVCNMRLKVMHADPPKFNDSDSSSDRKRPRK